MTPLILILGSGCVWTFVHSFSIKSYGVSPWTTNRVSSGFGKALVVAPNVQHLSMISFDDIGVMIYDSQLSLSNALSGLTQPSPGSFTLLFGAGLLSSLSPCSLSLLPLTTLYIVGSTPEKVNESDRMFKSLAYTTGLATTLTVFGLSASLLGDMFGQSGSLGDLSTFFTGFISIVMGLYLLELLYFEFPTFDGLFKNTSTTSRESLSDFSQAFLVGATTALIASPCSSPVLASLLTIVAKLGTAARKIVV